MTLIGACRDTLRDFRAESDAQPDILKQVLDEVKILSGKLVGVGINDSRQPIALRTDVDLRFVGGNVIRALSAGGLSVGFLNPVVDN